jgi:hypothetical protein
VSTGAPAAPGRHWIVWAVSCWLTGVVLTFGGFVWWHHSGPWLASVESRNVPASQLQVVRGSVRAEGESLVFERPGEDGSVVVTGAIEPPIEARDYRHVQVRATGALPREGLFFVWRTERIGKTVPRLPVMSSGGRILPIPLSALDGWNGKVAGVGLISRGPLAGPLRVHGLELQPASVWTTMGSMFSDWFEFEPWDGGSIHFMAGGNPSLRHPLPLFLGTAFVVSIALYLLLIVLGHTRLQPQVLIAIALLGWGVSDARWQWNLWKQLDITRHQYAGKGYEDKRRAAEDGPLFEFMRVAKEKMGSAPAHVFVFSEQEYDRVRGAYHLYPHNVSVQPRQAAILPAITFKPGDVIVLYRKRAVQYNAALKLLSWEGSQGLRAEMLHFADGSAVFRVLPP